MLNSTSDSPLRRTARIAGVLYLVIIAAGIFAQFFVRESLIVPGDAAATAANVTASEGLFRLGTVADLVMILADVAIAVAFFVLLQPVSTGLSLLAAFFRLVQASVLGMNLINLVIGLRLVSNSAVQGAVGAAQAEALGLLFFGAHSAGYTLALAFFGVSILVLGYLVMKAAYLPSILGALLMIAGAGYLVDTLANLLLPNYADYAAIFTVVVFVPAIIAELSMALWLLVKGVKREPDAQPDAVPAQSERQYA